MYRSSSRRRRPYGSAPRAHRPFIRLLAIGATIGFISFLLSGTDDTDAPEAGTGTRVQIELPDGTRPGTLPGVAGQDARVPFEPSVPKGPASLGASHGADDAGEWMNVTVAPGDNLSLIFSRLTLSKRDLHDIVALGDVTAQLKHIKPDQIIRIRTQDEMLVEMVLELDQLSSLKVLREGERFTASTESVIPEIKITAARTEITQSLFVDGQKAGLSDALIMRLTDIFGWDIDFALDLRENDRFSVIYEEIYKDDEFIKQDRILAAEFYNRGKRLRAVLYTAEGGRSAYYSDRGEAMRKAFLRTPVNFTRISSRFNLRRKHPILNTIRAHRGVDYAAPSGTPVRATADGKIRSIGRNGGYGRTVEMQHGEVYSTLYAHLSRYARGMTRGKSVRQGQIIGYVGKSGLATGPHLHYEFRVHGVHRNPLTVDLPKAEPIDKQYLHDFHERAKPLLAQLDVLMARRGETGSGYVAQLDLLSTPTLGNHTKQN